MFFSIEVDEERLDSLKQSRKLFFADEKKKLQEQVEDLTATLQINKQLLNEVFAANADASKDPESVVA